ncbi:MAG: GxxExxY protein [Bacteroidetes bacterium]|nr:GxxExxY protein [Bacteroidota bacterium]
MQRNSKAFVNALSYELVGAAIEVHRQLGPGLLESIYKQCMKIELGYLEIPFISERIIPIQYRNKEIDGLLRCDIFADELVVIEIKSVQSLLPIHEAQLLTYMKLLEAPKGILINFNVTHIFKEGQKTFVNEYYRSLPDGK